MDGFGKYHAGCRSAGKLRILGGADRLIEGGGARKVADGQVDEDQLGHLWHVLFCLHPPGRTAHNSPDIVCGVF
jgi:hypothetical protein